MPERFVELTLNSGQEAPGTAKDATCIVDGVEIVRTRVVKAGDGVEIIPGQVMKVALVMERLRLRLFIKSRDPETRKVTTKSYDLSELTLTARGK
ncbi:MAG TPA: hypothetical protein VF382_04310 [Actinomycetota bacterium]